MSRKRTGRTVTDAAYDLGGWVLLGVLGVLGFLTAKLDSLLLAVLVLVVPVALWRWRREVQALVERVFRGGPAVLPRGWAGELFAVYVWRWPHAEVWADVCPTLPLEWAGRKSYIGLDSSGVDERRAGAHARDGRSFVLPYATRTVYLLPTRQAMVDLERRLIREADAAGEPIVNRVRYRTAG